MLEPAAGAATALADRLIRPLDQGRPLAGPRRASARSRAQSSANENGFAVGDETPMSSAFA
jgi:hypothetical protein